jgi:hypothetical protein
LRSRCALRIEAIFTFEATEGRGSGVLRLTPDASHGNAPKAWTLLTALDEIKGHEEHLGKSRPEGKAYSPDFRGPNWFDLRKAAAEYAHHALYQCTDTALLSRALVWMATDSRRRVAACAGAA